MKPKLLLPLALLGLVVISPIRKSLLSLLREPWNSRSEDLQRNPDKEHGNTKAAKTGRDLRKAMDPDGVSDVKLVGPLAGWMQEEQQPQEPEPVRHYEAGPQDHIVAAPPPGTTNILHSTFPVRTYSSLEIQVPPGLLQASLTGTVDSFTVTSAHSRQLADVVVSLMNEAEFQDLVQKNPTSATYTTDPAPTHAIEWLLHSDFKQTRKYYLIFTNPAGKSSTRMVKATVSVHFY